ncbi:MAG: YaeQ family protein [Gammaproteobacteria bacterium]|nr:YaeQ family protein [Gammaproteobacteria bacterium]
MAIKPTIYKLRVNLSDLNRDYYDTLSLTIALHPSETIERMMARMLAFCINAEPELSFTKGLSSIEEPDIWQRTLDDQIALWIDIGEPASERIKKASRQAKKVSVYSFNSKSDVWWQQGQSKFKQLNVSVYRFDWPGIQALAALVERTMDFSVTITGDSAYIATQLGECEVSWEVLQSVS